MENLRQRRQATAETVTTPHSHSLVGRDRELRTLEELLVTVRGGGSSSLVIRGDPGIGKSALLEQLVSSASGFQVVRVIGVEGEVDLPYAGLHQLCGGSE